MEKLEVIGEKVKNTTRRLNSMSTKEKNIVLKQVAKAIIENKDKILNENIKDIQNAIKNNIKDSLIDRLRLNEKRIEDMAEGLNKTADLEDPIGEIIEGRVLENGLEILKKRVPLGVIAIIYE